MGHNITGRIAGKPQVVASLRISGRRRRETRFYDVLGVHQFNRLDSGSGDSAVFDSQQLRKLKTNTFLSSEERQFLEKLANTRAEGIEIEFA